MCPHSRCAAWLNCSVVRNAYTLLNWGDFVDESSAARGSPFIQLLPLTDPVQAHQEFVKARLGGVDTTGDPQYKLLAHGKSSPVSKGERVQHLEGLVRILFSVPRLPSHSCLSFLPRRSRRTAIALRLRREQLRDWLSSLASSFVAACAEEERHAESAG